MQQINLTTIKNKELAHIMFDEDGANSVLENKDNETVFSIELKAPQKDNELLDLEIALRKCQRVGVFNK